MRDLNYLSLDSSLLYRCSAKYFDRILLPYGFGSGQLFFLIQVYEHPGIQMNDLSQMGEFDKGTVTKAIAKLSELGYLTSEVNVEDKREKFLYCTAATAAIMPLIYQAKQNWWEHLFKDLSDAEIEEYLKTEAKIVKRARSDCAIQRSVNILGFEKLTLVDYPGKMAAIVFTGGCNFKCPFCHNKDLVFLNEKAVPLAHQTIFDYLKKRSKIIEALCISGGEPLLQEGICDFIRAVKALGVAVKLDTNGTQPAKLAYLLQEKLVDYVAMDIKNSKAKYALTAGIGAVDLEAIEHSIDLLQHSTIDYEFRTTVVQEFHESVDFKAIAQWVAGARHYYLQCFNDSENVITPGLHAPTAAFLKEARAILQETVADVQIRGAE